ncbi:peptidoglycan bridge formation glycyltransferase FemA/FemB family protein [Candidatus Poribacteria bacterium]|nr:peptidoglycan bridge formation glycyltransferase FemA/FemB family protein [Candidatus Poribacteria bacterium]
MNKNYECKEIKSKEIWDEFLRNNPNTQILQSYAWGEIKHKYSWDAIRLGIFLNNELKGVILLLKRKLPFSGGRSILYAPRGPIIDFNDSEIFGNLIDGIKKISKKHKAIVLKIDPFISNDDENKKKILHNYGFIKINQQIQPRCTFILDIDKPEDIILANFESKTRYNIKVAIKKGVKIKRAGDREEGVAVFYDLLKKTASRDQFTIHSKDYYHTVWNMLKADNRCEIFLASVEDKIAAGVFLFIFNKTCWYMYGASDNIYRNHMPNQLLHWEIILWAKQQGIKEYDLWGIPCDAHENHPLWGVYRFKKGFNGKLVKLIGCYDLPLSNLYFLWNKSLGVYKKIMNLKTRKSLNSALEE